MSVPYEQRVYAAWLKRGTYLAFLVLSAGFIAYVSGWIEPLVSFDRLPQVWSHPVTRYIEETGAPTGVRWLAAIGWGDYANLLGIGMLGMVAVVSYLRILPILIRRGERVLALLAALQIAVLLAAASGVLAGSS